MRTVSLTEGSIVRGSLLFTVPLILGNLFQQLYSATDSLVVGNFVGSGALAAVSASNQIVNLVIGFVIGLTTGAGIVIARHYGAGEYAALRRCISTAYLFCLVGGAAVSALGIAVSPVLLHLINTPEEILLTVCCICAFIFWERCSTFFIIWAQACCRLWLTPATRCIISAPPAP